MSQPALTDLAIGLVPLGLADVLSVARSGRRVTLSADAVARIASGRELIERLIDAGEVVYGVTTGFGARSGETIADSDRLAMQPRILRSHAVGSGAPLPDDVVRATLVLRANMLAHGNSSVRPDVVERLLDFLNHDIVPIVPEQGSVGASGDLAPLAHLSLPLIGEGRVRTPAGERTAAEALSEAGLEPITLEPKEASSLTNGTEVTLALAVLAVADASLLLDAAEIAAAMCFTAMDGHVAAYGEAVHQLRPHPGQIETARRMRELLATDVGAPPVAGRRPVHDIYSLRCVPQVLGPVREALAHVRATVEVEMDSVTDNPVCLPETGEVVSAGNFHGHPLALACDYLKTALASVGTFSERRIAAILDSRISGLPDLLSPAPESNNGLLMLQYAAASIASENKTLAHPASIDSISTAGGAEDYNSMSATAARHLRRVLDNTFRIVAMEVMCATQALDLRSDDPMSTGVSAAYGVVRETIPFLSSDEAVLYELIESVDRLVRSGLFQQTVADALRGR